MMENPNAHNPNMEGNFKKEKMQPQADGTRVDKTKLERYEVDLDRIDKTQLRDEDYDIDQYEKVKPDIDGDTEDKLIGDDKLIADMELGTVDTNETGDVTDSNFNKKSSSENY